MQQGRSSAGRQAPVRWGIGRLTQSDQRDRQIGLFPRDRERLGQENKSQQGSPLSPMSKRRFIPQVDVYAYRAYSSFDLILVMSSIFNGFPTPLAIANRNSSPLSLDFAFFAINFLSFLKKISLGTAELVSVPVTAVASQQTSEIESSHFRANQANSNSRVHYSQRASLREKGIYFSSFCLGSRKSDRLQYLLMTSLVCANLLDPIAGLRPVAFPGLIGSNQLDWSPPLYLAIAG